MRARSFIKSVTSLCLFIFVQLAAAKPPQSRCDYPPDLHDEISRKYPDTSLVSLADLSEYSRKLFQKEHGNRCPGLVRVNFYGDARPTWALLLVEKKAAERKAQLVVARQIGKDWETRLLQVADAAPVPVIWREGPGTYEGMSEPMKILAQNPVVILCGYGSWSILYAWTGKDVVKLQITD